MTTQMEFYMNGKRQYVSAIDASRVLIGLKFGQQHNSVKISLPSDMFPHGIPSCLVPYENKGIHQKFHLSLLQKEPSSPPKILFYVTSKTLGYLLLLS